MQDPSLVRLFVAPLNANAVEYMVTGGLAAVIYGHPRLTLDVDMVVRLGRDDISRFVSLWSPEQFYVRPAEVVEEESSRSHGGHFNVIHAESAMRADIYMAGDDALNAWAHENLVVRTVEGHRVKVAPLEAVILSKLHYFKTGGSDRHLRDIARMLEVSGEMLDLDGFRSWLTRLDLREAWEKAREFEE